MPVILSVNVRSLADEAVQSGMRNIDEIVDWIDIHVEEAQLRDAFRQALRSEAVMAMSRTIKHRSTRTPKINPADLTNPNSSKKWGDASVLYRQWLANEITVPGAGSKPLGRCTKAEVLAAAGARRKAASAIVEDAERLELLAKRLDQHKAATVADLNESIARKVMLWKPAPEAA